MKQVVTVTFQDSDLSDSEVEQLVRDALLEFADVRRFPQGYVERRYPEQSEAWQASKIMNVIVRTEAAEQADVMIAGSNDAT